MFKTLPNGAGDLASVELVRRSSSIKSRSSVASAASVASTSAASASEDDLASVGRRKSLSRASSLSGRPASSARSEKLASKKPHDLAHGHLADHPTHVSATYSPYPHHPPNKDHHHHHHHHHQHMHRPSPLARSEGGSSGRGTGSNNSPAASGGDGIPPVPPLPVMSDFALPVLGSLTASASQPSTPAPQHQFAPSSLPNRVNPPLPMLPPPAVLPAAQQPAYVAPQHQPVHNVKNECTTPAPHQAVAAPAPPPPAAAAAVVAAPPPPPPAMSNEQLASAFFFRDFPPEARSSSHSPNDTSQHGTTGAPPTLIKHEQPPQLQQQQFSLQQPVLPLQQHGYYASPPLVSPASSLESLAPIDPAAAAYVLGSGAERVPSVPLAPMYGEGELYYSDSGPLPVDDEEGDTYDASNGNGDYFDYRNVHPPTSSSASSDIYELPPRSTNLPAAAVYGYPLESVASYDPPSSYSGYESAASVTGGAAAALERLDLDFDLPRRRQTPPVIPASGTTVAEAQRPAPAPRLESSGTSSSAASAAAPQFMPGEDVQTTDLDGILEWLASSTAAGGLPPPPPSSRGEPSRHDSASSSATTWPSAPPSSYGDSGGGGVGRGYGIGAMYGGGGGWTSYSESEMQQRYSPPVPVPSSSSAAASGHGPNAAAAGPDTSSRTGGVTWATRSDEDDDDGGSVKEEINSAGERVGGPRKRERNADLEMLRTATITCRDASFSASASDSPDHAGGNAHDPNAWDSTRANSPRLDEDGNPLNTAAPPPRYARGHAFAAFIGDEFDRFGLGGELDDDWFRQFGVGSGLSGLGAAGLGDGEGEIGEDDGYEEDDEASVVGIPVSSSSSNPFDGNGFGDGYERDYEFHGGGNDDDDELGWDRDQTFGARPLGSSSSDDNVSPPSQPVHGGEGGGADLPSSTTTAAIDVVQSSWPSGPDNGSYDDGRRDHHRQDGNNRAGPEFDLAAPTSPTSPTSRLAAYLEQQEAKNEEDAHDRGAGMWW